MNEPKPGQQPPSDETRPAAPAPSSSVAAEDAPPPPAATASGGGRRSRYASRDLTTGSIPRNLWSLSWPQVIEGSLNTIDQAADLFWAGLGAGTKGIASIGVAQNYIQLIRLGRQGIDMSIRAMVSRSVGASDLALANHVVLQGFTINMVLALIAMVPGIVFSASLLRLLGVSEELVAVGTLYMQIQFVASTAQGFRMMTGAALQAAGDAVTPMKATTVARVLDLALTPLVVFGWLGLPEMGLPGIAAVNVLSGGIACGINVYALFAGSSKSKLKLTLRGYRLDYPLMWRMVKLGIPASVTNAERALAQLLVVGIVATFGDIAVAAWSLTRRAEMFANLGSQGLGNATGVIAGQSIGAGKPERARQTVAWAMAYVFIMRAVMGALFFAFPVFILSIFSRDPELLDVGAVWLRILVVSFVLQGPTQVFQQTFQIAGDTVMPMITVLATVWLIEIPLAAVLSGVSQDWTVLGWHPPLPVVTGLGQFGVAWAVSLGQGFRLPVYIPYFFWGPWARKRILGDRPAGLAGAMRSAD